MSEYFGTRRFTLADQADFAELSDDRNPMHMDPLVARRTQAGDQVVHGVHGFLWVLEMLAGDGVALDRMNSVRVQFTKFIIVDRDVTLHIRSRDESMIKAELMVDRLSAAVFILKFGSRSAARTDEALSNLSSSDPLTQPFVPSFEEMGTLSSWLPPPHRGKDGVERLFPMLCRSLGPRTVLSLAQLSSLVGMVCPGLHSIFSNFSLAFHESGTDRAGLGFRAVDADPRFRMVNMDVAGANFSGSVSAFARPGPIESPNMETIAALVAPDEFEGRTALVVGGSRGLGAATAKILAAGGANVILTYMRGREEAEAIADEIRIFRADPASARLLSYDAGGDPEEPLASLPVISHLYYFATPRIFLQSADAFSRIAYESFSAVYVAGFYKLVHFLTSRSDTKALSVLYPSSVAIEERPKGMTEYAMAKAAAEILCADLARATPGLEIATPRLPRVQTDQTATVLPVPARDATDVMLSLLRHGRLDEGVRLDPPSPDSANATLNVEKRKSASLA